MSKADLEQWAIEVFWPEYRRLVETPYKDSDHGPGVKGQCVSTILKLNPSKDLQAKMVKAIELQAKHRQELFERLNKNIPLYNDTTYKSRDRMFYANRHGRTWINAMGWVDDIPEIVTEKEARKQGKRCIVCGEPTYGVRFDHCFDHLPEIGAAH